MDFKTFQAVPKAELHVHLEGAMTLERVLALAAEQPQHPWFGLSRQALVARFKTRNFDAFIQQFMNGYRLLRERRHFQQVTEDLCAGFEHMGVTAAHVLYSPGVYSQKLGVSVATIHDGIEAGLRAFPHLRVVFVIDTVLNLGFDFMQETLNRTLADRRSFVAGFSVGGGSPQLDMGAFVPLFHQATRAGLFCVAHAGEVDGPENIRILLEQTEVCRIAHGCSAVTDPAVLDLLRDRSIVVDVNLTSNLFTGTVDRLEHHPLPRFLEHGIAVTLNTDDPLYFDTDLYREYALAARLGCDDGVLRRIMAQSLSVAEP